MEQFITTADFVHADDDIEHDFCEAVKDWARHNSETVTLADVRRWLKLTQDKVCQPDYPAESSPGYWMGYHLIDTLLSLASDLIDEGKAQPSDFQEGHLNFILNMISVGPLYSHVAYIEKFQEHSDVEFDGYFKGLRGKDLTRVLQVLKKDYKGDPNMDYKDYLSGPFDRFFSSLLNDFSNEQFEVEHQQFAELYMFFNNNFLDRDVDTCKEMHRIAYLIELEYDRNVFKDITDVPLMTKWFGKVSEVILAPRFPQSEDAAKEVCDELFKILKAVSEGGLIGSMYEVIMDFALNLTIKKANCEGTRKHFETIGYFFFHINEDGVKNNEKLYGGLVEKFIYFLNNVKDVVYLSYKFVEPVMYDCLNKAMGTSEKQVRQWVEMIKALLKHSIPNCVDAAYRAMREKDTLLKWKKMPEDIKEIFALLSNIAFPKWLTEKQYEKGMKQLETISEHFLDEAKKVGMAKLEMTGPMLKFVLHCLDMHTPEFCSLALAVSRRMEYNPKKDKVLIIETLEKMTAFLEDDRYDMEDRSDYDVASPVLELISKAMDNIKDGKFFTWDEYDDLIYLCKICQPRTLDASEPHISVFYNIFIIISLKVITWLQTMNETHRVIPLLPGIIQWLESDDDDVQDMAVTELGVLSRTSGNLFANHLDKLITLFLDNEKSEILMTIAQCYEFNRGPMEKHFDSLYEYVDSGNSGVRSFMLQLLQKVAKYQPHLFDEDKVSTLVKEAREEQQQQPLVLMALVEIAKRGIHRLDPHIGDFMKADLWQPHSAYAVYSILQLYALESEENADKVINYIMERLRKSSDNNEIIYALNACRLIGFKHRPALEKHRAAIEKMNAETSNNDLHTCYTSILDMLDGKSLDKVQAELKELQGDVAELEERVTATETDIADVKDTVQRQGDDLDNVKNDVSEQGQRLDEVKDTVATTAAKVQEIDGKTLSHAPVWARDVSRLLNPETDCDWRLLTLRLGYTNDDIRAWSQHPDPCMAMLDDWFATHRAREATHGVLTSLQLLDRLDAAVIVENAMKNAENLVEDDFEYATPPDIFLSYQWGHQDEVRLLRQHLEMAGFSCWMDVGQMGGGDKLFEKIDSGVRGAKVILSCVTAKYAKSPNCNREVNLSVNLGKPLIPLLMEKLSWPPPGSMGPVFSEFLFIRFFQRGEAEGTPDQRYWPPPKFQELLMQLSGLGVKPDLTIIQPEYKDWWLPKVEQITIDKDRAQKQQAVTTPNAATNDQAAESPDVFISYQWGKQPQIIKLYERLTSLGYSCWLDIMQMGGGDSLYDKIDRGLRGCRVVLSSITTKYAKSANCRREVSLADALQKPLAPLLLESMPWPPPGPMSPILTQLLYIDCTRDNMEETWEGPKFDEIVAFINQNLPRPPAEGSDTKASKSSQESAAPVPGGDSGQRKEGDGSGDPQPPPPPPPQSQATPAPQAANGKGDAASSPQENVDSSSDRPPPQSQAPPTDRKEAGPDDRQAGEKAEPEQKFQAPPTDRKEAEPDDGLTMEKTKAKAGVRRTASEASSLNSYLGHDLYNDACMFSGDTHIMRAKARKSACCIIL